MPTAGRSQVLDQKASRRAAGQQGLITRSEAKTLGFTDRMIDRRLATGRWRRLAAGIYALAGVPETFEQRALAACLAAGPGAVLSHRTAGAVWGLPGCEAAKRPGAPIEVLVPHAGRGHRCQLAVVHRSRRLGPADRSEVAGLPVTTPARTLIDLAMPPCRPAQLTEQVDDAVCRAIVSIDRLRRRMRAVCGRGRAGTRRMRSVVGEWNPHALPASRPEARLERWLAREGLGGISQHVVTAGGSRMTLDRAWPDCRLALEVDSYRWHGTPSRYRATARRAARLRAAGWEVHSITPEQIDGLDGNVPIALRLALARLRQATVDVETAERGGSRGGTPCRARTRSEAKSRSDP